MPNAPKRLYPSGTKPGYQGDHRTHPLGTYYAHKLRGRPQEVRVLQTRAHARKPDQAQVTNGSKTWWTPLAHVTSSPQPPRAIRRARRRHRDARDPLRPIKATRDPLKAA